jgi:hypothetical protein
MSVLGDVLGELSSLDGDVLGAVQSAVSTEVTKRTGGMHRAAAPGAFVHLQKPHWRGGEMAPGVNLPLSGQVPLPLIPLQGNGVFSTTNPVITFEGKLQKPYQAERLLTVATRSNVGGSASLVQVVGQIFVGVDLNQAQLQPVNLEVLGAGNSFDTRMRLFQAPPGVIVSILASLFPTGSISGTDSVAVTLMFLGEVIH